MKRQVLIHSDLSWQEPSDRADPEVVREPAGHLGEPDAGAPDASSSGSGEDAEDAG